MSRKSCSVGEEVKKGIWTTEEDKKLISYIHEHGEGGWRDIPKKAGLKRCGKSCRLRWSNYLKPEIKRGEFSSEEEQIIIMLHASRGNKWSDIARHLPRRTDNEIKNYWKTHLTKRLIQQGIDPVTHKALASNSNPTVSENLDSLNAPTPYQQYSQPISNDGTSVQAGSLSCKKSNSTSRVLNKVASKATSIKEILLASIEGSLSATTISQASFFNDFCMQIRSERNSTNASMSLSHTLAEFDSFEIDTTSDLDMDQGYDFSNFLENLVGGDVHADENNMNVEYGHDILMSDVSKENSLSSVQRQDNMLGNFEDWSNCLLEDTDFIYDTDSDSLEKHFI